jgi:hypothetical protein
MMKKRFRKAKLIYVHIAILGNASGPLWPLLLLLACPSLEKRLIILPGLSTEQGKSSSILIVSVTSSAAHYIAKGEEEIG